mmetsp:Transcript_3688/g.9374  ORF Transcript_3688/g.9374 Transcript_3688/m.9374 type:complete len:259 (-) Transcript_3688:430-1206(-)
MVPCLETSISLNIACTLMLLKAPLKKVSALKRVITIALSVSMALKSCSHFIQVFADNLLKIGRRGNFFWLEFAVVRPSFQSTHAPPCMSSSSSSSTSWSLYPDFRTWIQNATNSSAVIAPLPSTSTSLNMASALRPANAPLKKARASSLVTALLPSTSIMRKNSSSFFQTFTEILHPIGLFGNGFPRAWPSGLEPPIFSGSISMLFCLKLWKLAPRKLEVLFRSPSDLIASSVKCLSRLLSSIGFVSVTSSSSGIGTL